MPKKEYFNFFEDVDDIDDVFWESKRPYPQISWPTKPSTLSSRCSIRPTNPQDQDNLQLEDNNNKGEIFGIQIELLEAIESLIPNGAPIIFNVIVSQAGSAITYNHTTGIVTISQRGYYLVNWWVSIDGTGLTSNVIFALNKNGAPQSQASSLPMSGQISASALITVESVPTTLSITNISGVDIALGNLKSQAGMVIISMPTSQ